MALQEIIDIFEGKKPMRTIDRVIFAAIAIGLIANAIIGFPLAMECSPSNFEPPMSKSL